MMHYSALLVDDHELIRLGLEVKIKETGLFTEIFHSSNGRQAIEFLKGRTCDLVFMDILMPEMNGILTTTYIRSAFPKTKVLALSSLSDKKSICDMIAAGAMGFISKGADSGEIKEAVFAVLNNRPFYSGKIAAWMIDDLEKEKTTQPKSQPDIKLNHREIDILRLICQEFSSKQIADLMSLSPRTVEKYRDNLMEKTGSQNMVGLVMFALSKGIISVE